MRGVTSTSTSAALTRSSGRLSMEACESSESIWRRLGSCLCSVRHPILLIVAVGIIIRLVLMSASMVYDLDYWAVVIRNIESGEGLYDAEGYYYTPVWGYVLGFIAACQSMFLELGEVAIRVLEAFPVEIIPDTTSACRIQGNVELFFTYKFNGSTSWSSYYDLDLNVTGLDSVSHIALKTHRVQDQIEYHSWLDGIPFDRDSHYCTYADCGDTLAFEHTPMRRLVKGFFPAYIIPCLDGFFYSESGVSTIKSLTENYRGDMKNINRNISEKLRIKIDTEIRSIADNYLNVHSRLWRQPTADGTTYLHDTHDTYPENE